MQAGMMSLQQHARPSTVCGLHHHHRSRAACVAAAAKQREGDVRRRMSQSMDLLDSLLSIDQEGPEEGFEADRTPRPWLDQGARSKNPKRAWREAQGAASLEVPRVCACVLCVCGPLSLLCPLPAAALCPTALLAPLPCWLLSALLPCWLLSVGQLPCWLLFAPLPCWLLSVGAAPLRLHPLLPQHCCLRGPTMAGHIGGGRGRGLAGWGQGGHVCM